MHNKHKKPALIINMFGMVNKHRGKKTIPETYSGGCAVIAVIIDPWARATTIGCWTDLTAHAVCGTTAVRSPWAHAIIRAIAFPWCRAPATIRAGAAVCSLGRARH